MLCCDRAAIMLPAWEMLVFHRSAFSVWECLLQLMLKTASSEAWSVNFSLSVKEKRKP